MGRLYVEGFKPPDEKWRAMKAVYDACRAAGVDVPPVVEKFFNGVPPAEHGVRLDHDALKKLGVLTDWEDGDYDGFDIDLTKLPPDVKVLRAYRSY